MTLFIIVDKFSNKNTVNVCFDIDIDEMLHVNAALFWFAVAILDAAWGSSSVACIYAIVHAHRTCTVDQSGIILFIHAIAIERELNWDIAQCIAKLNNKKLPLDCEVMKLKYNNAVLL